MFARAPLPCQETARDSADAGLRAIRRRLYRSRRWAHASVAPGKGDIAGNAIALYGFSGSSIPRPKEPLYTEQEALLSDFLEAAAAEGASPLIAGGDLNSNGQYSRVLEAAFESGEFVDAARCWAARQGIPEEAVEPTCYP